jgi:hypothetical protein
MSSTNLTDKFGRSIPRLDAIKTAGYDGGVPVANCNLCNAEFPLSEAYRHECEKPFHVYFVEGGGLVKIGIAQFPEIRLRALQVGSPVPLRLLKVIPIGRKWDAYRKEEALHEQFAAHRVHGEWFRSEILNMLSDSESMPKNT